MLDMVGAIAGTALYAVVVGVLIGLAPVSPLTRLGAVAAAAGWGGIIVALAALGGFAPGATGPIPAPGLAFGASLALLFGGWRLVPRFREALLSVPVPVLVGLNVGRLGGVSFLLLAAEGRLSAPFAPVAGAGDMLVAVLAVPSAVMAARGVPTHPGWLRLWNALGAADLIVAVSLGLLSAPGTPFRIFTEEPGALAMMTLPWLMVPALLVPLYLLIHLTIAVKLRSWRTVRREPSTVGSDPAALPGV